MLYSLKIFIYILTLLKKPEYIFLNHLTLRTKYTAFMHLLILATVCFLPVLIYSVFIYAIGFSQAHTVATFFVLGFQILLLTGTAGVLVLFLQTRHRFAWVIAQIRIPAFAGRVGFYASYILSEEKIAIFISKVFSLGLIYIVREATEVGDDFRITGLTWVFVLLAHTFIVRKVVIFEGRYLNWIKGLPLPVLKTFSIYIVVYAGLLLPELLLAGTMVKDVFELVVLVLFSSGLLMFVHMYLLKPDRDPEKFAVFLFWLAILSFFSVLCKLIFPLSFTLIAAAYIRLLQRYYRYEPIIE
jgi:hypothetical protein